ncbi:MAG: bacteriophage abortive infection AbiH family protein [Lachnospiraceae bacterium]|nr:bacteriophage abortive infection AbiH family protein [Lachnospiraceae bacterium]
MADKGKKILILGNGFDLAHGLPTKYSHFLEFCQKFEMLWNNEKNKNNKIIGVDKTQQFERWLSDELIRTFFEPACHNKPIMRSNKGYIDGTLDYYELSEIHALLVDNVWFEYFKELYSTNCMKGENWIDFESEIRFIVKEVDQESLSLTKLWDNVIDKAIAPYGNTKLNIFKNRLKFDKYMQRKGLNSKYKITIRDFREKAFEDLERLTRVLEFYLAAFVEKIPVREEIPEISSLNPDYVINFNYTDTYERIYKKGEVYHIHGKADVNHSAEDNNMVLGIDEYWLGNDRDERTNFTIFKKFAQRIQKHTGNESYRYLYEMQKLFKAGEHSCSDNVDLLKEHPDWVSYVYVFGHSLDVTDKDILSGFIGDDSTSVTVYCKDKGTEGELIANTIKLIGEEKLLAKSNHLPTKLDYIIQQEHMWPLK